MDTIDCPTCDRDDFDSERGMKIHHKMAHGESLARKQSVCVFCDSEFEYYPSASFGKVCPRCTSQGRSFYNSALYDVEHWQKKPNEFVKDSQGKREVLKKYKKFKTEQGCANCGYDEDFRALEYHHIDPEQKEYDISYLAIRGVRWEEVLKEIRKCIVLCKNCHAVTHGAQV